MNKHLPPLLCAALALAPSAAMTASDPGRAAPRCALTRLDSPQQMDLQQYKGKVVYVDFWASWCGPCAQSFPYMNELERDLKDRGLQVVAINLDENPEEAKAFLTKIPANFTIAADIKGQCATDFGVQAMPSSYLLDRNGVIRQVHLGFREGEAKEFRAQVEALLKEPAQ